MSNTFIIRGSFPIPGAPAQIPSPEDAMLDLGIIEALSMGPGIERRTPAYGPCAADDPVPPPYLCKPD